PLAPLAQATCAFTALTPRNEAVVLLCCGSQFCASPNVAQIAKRAILIRGPRVSNLPEVHPRHSQDTRNPRTALPPPIPTSASCSSATLSEDAYREPALHRLRPQLCG